MDYHYDTPSSGGGGSGIPAKKPEKEPESIAELILSGIIVVATAFLALDRFFFHLVKWWFG